MFVSSSLSCLEVIPPVPLPRQDQRQYLGGPLSPNEHTNCKHYLPVVRRMRPVTISWTESFVLDLFLSVCAGFYVTICLAVHFKAPKELKCELKWSGNKTISGCNQKTRRNSVFWKDTVISGSSMIHLSPPDQDRIIRKNSERFCPLFPCWPANQINYFTQCIIPSSNRLKVILDLIGWIEMRCYSVSIMLYFSTTKRIGQDVYSSTNS